GGKILGKVLCSNHRGHCMGRRASITYPLRDGRTVGASLKLRGIIYAIQFPDPSTPGKYLEKSTGCTSIADAQSEGARIILRHYAPTRPTDPRRVTWDQVEAELPTAAPLRERTLQTYQSAIRNLRQY